MRIVCISDTHGKYKKIKHIPDADVLIHAGDSLGVGGTYNLGILNEWLGTLPHKHKILIAGNHDWCFQNQPEEARATVTNAIYLEDSGISIGGYHFWGSPWTPRFHDMAFNLDRGEPLKTVWQRIPDNIDVLITHGPPAGVRDTVVTPFGEEQVGCVDLRSRLFELRNLKAHVFGHVHEGYGSEVWENMGLRFVNASTCNGRFQPSNLPIVFDL